jgi:hypothetical protein
VLAPASALASSADILANIDGHCRAHAWIVAITTTCNGKFNTLAQYFPAITNSQCNVLYRWILEGVGKH